MQSTINTSNAPSDFLIAVDGIKMALAKFPKIRNPTRYPTPVYYPDTRPLMRPKIYPHKLIQPETLVVKTKRIRRELLDAGATFYGLLKAESRFLPKLLHDNEHVEAVIYGVHNSSL